MPRHGRGHRFKSCRTHHFFSLAFSCVTIVSQQRREGMATIRKRKGKWQVQVRHLCHNQISKSFFILSISYLNNSLTQKYNQYVWMLMVRYRQVVQSRKMLLALWLYKQYLYYVAPIVRLQGRLRIFYHRLVT